LLWVGLPFLRVTRVGLFFDAINGLPFFTLLSGGLPDFCFRSTPEFVEDCIEAICAPVSIRLERGSGDFLVCLGSMKDFSGWRIEELSSRPIYYD